MLTDAFAQKMLLFTNTAKNKVIVVKEGQFLSLRYKGYMGQTDFTKQIVTEITDSTITLGTDPEIFDAKWLKENEGLIKNYRIVRISDITAFRRMTLGRHLLKTMVTIGVFVGSYFLLYDVYRNPEVNAAEGFAISLGVAVGAKLLLDLALPEKPNHKLTEGWSVRVVEAP
jgi:hypothetical protein